MASELSQITMAEGLTILALPLGVPFMMLSLNGPMKILRTRKKCLPTEGTIVDMEQAPAYNFQGRYHSSGTSNPFPDGAWCPVYSYTLADGRTIKSSVTNRLEWRRKKEDIVIGKKVPLLYLPSDPLKIERADLPLFDEGDTLFFCISFLLMIGAPLYWPKCAAIAYGIVGLYFLLRSGYFAKPPAQESALHG